MYNILSPDGIFISHESFQTKEEALSFLNKWISQFENQQYYSSNSGRIDLDVLSDYCEIVKL